MTVALDTNVLLDIISQNAEHRRSSLQKVRDALRDGAVIVGEVVFAELSPSLADHASARAFLDAVGISYQASSAQALHHAGTAFRAYLQRRVFRCARCGTSVNMTCPNCRTSVTGRQHVVADFMIGAHALVHAGRLLTRDRGYYSTYFPDLVLV